MSELLRGEGGLEGCEQLPRSALWQAAILAHQAGSHRLARRVFHRGTVPELIRHYGFYQWQSPLRVLADVDPSSALRVLRATRPRGIRSDESEQSTDRRELLATAHESLGRLALAARLRASPKTVLR